MALRASRAARLGCSPAPVAHQTEAASQEIAESPSPPAADLPETGQSIFAGFCGHVETCAPTHPDDCAPQQNDTAPEMSAPSDHDTPAAASLPLSAIGFGPGMTIRMRQVGIETVSDLAASEPAALRSALGDISQLINVDLWIASARKTQAQ